LLKQLNSAQLKANLLPRSNCNCIKRDNVTNHK